MRWKPALGALFFIAAIPLAVSELLGPVWSMAVVLIGIGAGWLLVPGFWRSLLTRSHRWSGGRSARSRAWFADCDAGGRHPRPGEDP